MTFPDDTDKVIFPDDPATDPEPAEETTLDPGAIVFPTPIFERLFLNGITFQSVKFGFFTFLIDLRYPMRARRGMRLLPQAEQDENTQYKKVMIGHDLYRRFTIAHIVSDYQETIFTENVKPIDVKHLTKIMGDGSEYHRYSAGEEQIKVEGILLPEDQQPKKEAVECIQTEPLPCVKTKPMPKRGNKNPRRRPNSNGKSKPNIAIKKPTRSISFKNGAAPKKRPEDRVKPKTN